MMKNGFALPTVLIASVVMMMVLLSGLTSASSINTAIRSQHYNKMAQRTAESGIAFTQACLKKNNNVAQWSNASKLRPNTDCSGVADGGYTCVTPTDTLVTIDQRCAVVKTDNVLTTFEVSGLSGAGAEKVATVTARVYLIRSSSSSGIVSSSKVSVQQSVVFKNNPAASRPAKKFWLFGLNAGLDFDTSGTNATSTTKCASGQVCEAPEGATVISTKDGTLQFWTDGRTIWNRNGLVMSNSSGLTASQSATQAAAVFPLGGSETKYVVVTNNTVSSYTASENKGELSYSIVDMSLDGGLGGIPVTAPNTTKNIPLWGANIDYASEALTAAPKPDGSGYWVVTFTPDSTRVLVFGFDNAANVTPPAVGTGNAPFTPGKYSSLTGFGTINFSPDYSRLIMMAGNHCSGTPCSVASGLLRFMSFDTSSGAVGNLLHWDHNSAAGGGQGYSADFSPSGNYIYSTTLYQGRIFRYTLAGANTGVDVKNSESLGYDTAQTTNFAPGYGGGQVVRGPDNKMYVANYGANAISVINTPDAALAANIGWVYNGRSLCVALQPCDANNSVSRYGLPQMVTIYSPVYLRY